MAHPGLPGGVARPCAAREGWRPGLLEASCGASEVALARPQYDGPGAFSHLSATLQPPTGVHHLSTTVTTLLPPCIHRSRCQVCAERLWVLGGDAPPAGALPMGVW